ncbi:CoxG family protein [Limnohabitans sp. 15K]|uniref:CoxG family protein n=1 Tax=Limnohabitans sp. 15K TaxID=1100706 RepID=UPI000C1DCF71|nr:carbon monoxide dehydrogenase subunit G [Limnohabitans sp. 15K]PIT80108.1 carbon monoxide dehydrogenase [Limnohabitans sp. 15K]
MDMTGQRTLQVTQQQVWEALNDPEILKACIPGCQKFEPSGNQKFAVAAGIKMGPVSALFNGSVQLTDIVAPQSYKLNFDAQGGVAGFGKGEAAVEIKPLEKGCELHYTVHSSVGGKIAQLGQRLIDGVAKNMAEDFFKRFEAELEKRYPPVPEPLSLGSAPVPNQASSGLPAWMWGLGLVVVVAAVAIAYL